ncbi:MAG: holo-[acyl-carrier-protein] synthase [SAR202 cluster bacterium Io17-Chloro-G4]|nr:MAG: holo-[acyl-carrier-protein] synthase [SAR202 cluster bacterium Io17-Chloro-G4]
MDQSHPISNFGKSLGTGVDIIEISRVAGVFERYGQRFLNRIYTPDEIAYCRGRVPNLAGRFAAKEAVMKALGTGVRGVGWRDIEVARHESGAPSILLHGRAKSRAQRLGVCDISVSMSHSRDYAVAFVVVQREPAP